MGEGRAQTARRHDAAAGQGASVARKEADAIAATLETRLDAQAATPARAAPALHRLNRTEYANAIRDLFGMPVDVSGPAAAGRRQRGFDNVASGLGISPALIQGYTSRR